MTLHIPQKLTLCKNLHTFRRMCTVKQSFSLSDRMESKCLVTMAFFHSTISSFFLRSVINNSKASIIYVTSTCDLNRSHYYRTFFHHHFDHHRQRFSNHSCKKCPNQALDIFVLLLFFQGSQFNGCCCVSLNHIILSTDS